MNKHPASKPHPQPNLHIHHSTRPTLYSSNTSPLVSTHSGLSSRRGTPTHWPPAIVTAAPTTTPRHPPLPPPLLVEKNEKNEHERAILHPTRTTPRARKKSPNSRSLSCPENLSCRNGNRYTSTSPPRPVQPVSVTNSGGFCRMSEKAGKSIVRPAVSQPRQSPPHPTTNTANHYKLPQSQRENSQYQDKGTKTTSLTHPTLTSTPSQTTRPSPLPGTHPSDQHTHHQHHQHPPTALVAFPPPSIGYTSAHAPSQPVNPSPLSPPCPGPPHLTQPSFLHHSTAQHTYEYST